MSLLSILQDNELSVNKLEPSLYSLSLMHLISWVERLGRLRATWCLSLTTATRLGMSIPGMINERFIYFMAKRWGYTNRWCLYRFHSQLGTFAAFAHWRCGLNVSSTLTFQSHFGLMLSRITVIFLLWMETPNDLCVRKIKKRKKWSMPITKTKQVQLFWNDSQKVTFHELKKHLKLSYSWLHIWGVMVVFLF